MRDQFAADAPGDAELARVEERVHDRGDQVRDAHRLGRGVAAVRRRIGRSRCPAAARRRPAAAAPGCPSGRGRRSC